jgi:glycogen debranching enzyme
LDKKDREYYTGCIAKKIFSSDFLTDAGIRSRSLENQKIPGYVDYHGSFSVWHKETNEIAKGLRSFKLYELASKLEERILDAVTKAAEFSELLYVDENNKPNYDNAETIHYLSAKYPGYNIPIPEPGQAWTISAVYRICLSDKLNLEYKIADIEAEILKLTPDIT